MNTLSKRRRNLIELAKVSLQHGYTEKQTIALIEAEYGVSIEQEAVRIVRMAATYLGVHNIAKENV